MPPKYVSSQIGEVHIKSLFMDKQLQSDVLRELARAAMIVEQNPRHENTGE